MDFRDSPEQRTLREEVSRWLDENLPDIHDPSPGGVDYDPPAYPEAHAATLDFNKRLAERGWLTAHWPREYGGLGLSIMEQFVLRETLAEYEAPVLNVNGLDMLAPVLMLYGTDEQQKEHLPPIARAERIWCQGYSEPNSGSDLASLSTSAVRDGDEWVVNGGKIWTGHGSGADWMFLLARTDPQAPKHRGITFFMLDMRTPGVTLHRLKGMHGHTMGCQEYFEDVRIPHKNVVGDVNRGWYIGAALLDFERSGIAGAVAQRRKVLRMIDFFRKERLSGVLDLEGRPWIRRVLAERYIETEVARGYSRRIAGIQDAGGTPNYEASMATAFGKDLSRRIAEAGYSLGGLFSQAGMGSRWDDGERTRHMFGIMMGALAGIPGGTTEIQRNIIATRGLGLPRG